MRHQQSRPCEDCRTKTARPNNVWSKGLEGKDFNEDTNFGKLKRIPHADLQAFIKQCQALSLGVTVVQVVKIPEQSDDSAGQSLLDLIEERKENQ